MRIKESIRRPVEFTQPKIRSIFFEGWCEGWKWELIKFISFNSFNKAEMFGSSTLFKFDENFATFIFVMSSIFLHLSPSFTIYVQNKKNGRPCFTVHVLHLSSNGSSKFYKFPSRYCIMRPCFTLSVQKDVQNFKSRFSKSSFNKKSSSLFVKSSINCIIFA